MKSRIPFLSVCLFCLFFSNSVSSQFVVNKIFINPTLGAKLTYGNHPPFKFSPSIGIANEYLFMSNISILFAVEYNQRSHYSDTTYQNLRQFSSPTSTHRRIFAYKEHQFYMNLGLAYNFKYRNSYFFLGSGMSIFQPFRRKGRSIFVNLSSTPIFFSEREIDTKDLESKIALDSFLGFKTFYSINIALTGQVGYHLFRKDSNLGYLYYHTANSIIAKSYFYLRFGIAYAF